MQDSVLWACEKNTVVIVNNKIIAAVQEERFTRIKFDSSYPINSINYCLNVANINIEDVNEVVYFEKNHFKFDRILKTYFNKFLTQMKFYIYIIML